MGNLGCGCAGSMAKVIERPVTEETSNVKAVSELRQWPVQLHLVPPTAPYLKEYCCYSDLISVCKQALQRSH